MQVYLSVRSWPAEALSGAKPFGDCCNIYGVPGFEGLSADGSVHFVGGRSVPCVDTVLFATGYTYDFPFLRAAAAVTTSDNRCCICREGGGYSFAFVFGMLQYNSIILHRALITMCVIESGCVVLLREAGLSGLTITETGRESGGLNSCISSY